MSTLPPLPAFGINVLGSVSKSAPMKSVRGYTADQMQAYAESAREIAAQPGEGEPFVPHDYSDNNGATCIKCGATDWDTGTACKPSPPHVADALDGERYRWLVGNSTEELCVRSRGANPTHPHLWAYYRLTGSAIDRAIDAAIAARAEAGGES